MMKKLTATPLVLLVACGAEDPDCSSGFEARDDGLCYELQGEDTDDPQGEEDDEEEEETSDPATIAEVLADLPPCTADTAGSGTLDLANACVQGACAGATFQEVDDALGGGSTCTGLYYEVDGYGSFSFADCAWPGGIEAQFQVDEAGTPQPSDETSEIFLLLPNDDTTADGLGLGVEMSCFVEALGEPDYVAFRRDIIGWNVVALSIGNFTVSDYYSNSDGSYGSDGLIDSLTLYGY